MYIDSDSLKHVSLMDMTPEQAEVLNAALAAYLNHTPTELQSKFRAVCISLDKELDKITKR